MFLLMLIFSFCCTIKLKKMHSKNTTSLLHFLLILTFFFPTYLAEQNPETFCGKIKIQSPFLPPQNSSNSSKLNQLIKCKSQTLYFRTSIGLFPISSIDYKSKLLTISHNFSSSTHFVSPSNLSSGFPSPPQPNSLILLDCSIQENQTSHVFRKCEATYHGASLCLVVDDVGNLDLDFHPNDLKCSKYRRVYRRSALSDRFELGTRISYDMPDHVPNPCDECEKSNGNCGAGLRCICHPRDCRDKVVSSAVKLNPFGNAIFWSLSFIVVVMHLFIKAL